MNRYLPPVAIELVPDIAVIFGYVWSGLMFFSAALNVIVALNFSVVTWSLVMSIYGIVSKAALFLIGYATMRTVGVARRRRQQLRDLPGDHLRDAEVMLAGDVAVAPTVARLRHLTHSATQMAGSGCAGADRWPNSTTSSTSRCG